jgi:formylglycine-generating enzyme required for sulfatase activity
VSTSVNKLIKLLQQADIEFTPTDLADVLWLASFITVPPLERSSDSASSFPEIENQKTTDSPPLSTDETDNQISESETTENIHSLENKLKLYPNSTTGNSGKAGNASAIRVPRKSFLPNRRELMRALRPLQRKVSNPYHLELSIEETVNLSAQLGWIQCVAMPAKMAWLELILIVDTSPSMQMWDKTIHEWLSLLQRNRAFENIRIYRMDASQAMPTFKPAKPVLSPARQQAIWIVSDCISAAWHSGQLFKYLKRWQKLQPLAIVQMLPFNMWKRTALGRGEECRFYPPVRAGLPTAQWRSDAPETVLNLPVFTLDMDSHSVYAQLFVAARDVWSSGFVHTAATKYSETPPASNNELSPEDIEKRLTQFRRLASPSAQTLAAYLAAVPLTLPIMRLVQDEMWKKYHEMPPQQSHLAEVLLSGLVKQRELFGAQGYDFLAGVRPKLLDGISVYEEGAAVLRVVSEYVSTHAGSCVDFRALLENPESVEEVNTFELPPDSQHFAEVGAEVLARMGGKYRAITTSIRGKYRRDTHEKPLKNIKLFYSYSYKDEELRNRLETHLMALKRQEIIDDWHDHKISLGAEWHNVLDENLKAADIILLLVSSDFITSGYCETEMKYAIQQHEAGKAVVIPIMLRPCMTEGLEFMKLQCAPENMKPVTEWVDQNEAFIDIAKKIQMVVENIRKHPSKNNELSVHEKIVLGKPRTFQTKKAGKFETFTVYEKTFYITPDVPLVMVYVPAGEFMMGSNDGHNEKPVHLVKIEQAFYMGKFPVTQEQYQAVMGENPSYFKGSNYLPVESVSKYQAKEFCEKLSILLEQEFRLPSESEWEYACRAGTDTGYWWGNKIEHDRFWHSYNSGGQTHSVDKKMDDHVNPFGLCDTHGNVWEWCEDNYEDNYNAPRTQVAHINSSGIHLLRGGSWYSNPYFCRSFYRGRYIDGDTHHGIRIAFSSPVDHFF